jgi:hypothetical protein
MPSLYLLLLSFPLCLSAFPLVYSFRSHGRVRLSLITIVYTILINNCWSTFLHLLVSHFPASFPLIALLVNRRSASLINSCYAVGSSDLAEGNRGSSSDTMYVCSNAPLLSLSAMICFSLRIELVLLRDRSSANMSVCMIPVTVTVSRRWSALHCLSCSCTAQARSIAPASQWAGFVWVGLFRAGSAVEKQNTQSG